MLRFLRVKLLPTVLLNVLVAVGISGGPWDPSLTLLMLLQGTCLYLFGMGLNDRIDLERDRKNAEAGLQPARPLVSGEIQLQTADRLIGFFFLGSLFTAVAIYLLKREAALEGLLLIAATLGFILLYNCCFKLVPILGPLCMGLVRGSLILSASTLQQGSLPDWTSLASQHAIAMTLYIFAVTHFSMEEERSRTSALKVRKAGVLIAFTLPFLCVYLFGDGDMTTSLLILFLHALLYAYFLTRPHPPLPPQRTTFLFLAFMTWIDFVFLWADASERHFTASPSQTGSTTEDILSILGIPLWMILWFLWVIFGLGFRDRTLQSSRKNSSNERPAP